MSCSTFQRRIASSAPRFAAVSSRRRSGTRSRPASASRPRATPCGHRRSRRALLEHGMRVVCLVVLVAQVALPPAVGDLHVLVTGVSPEQAASAADFFERSSFGRLHLHIDVTGAPDGYDAVVSPGRNLV